MIAEGLHLQSWVRDIHGALGPLPSWNMWRYSDGFDTSTSLVNQTPSPRRCATTDSTMHNLATRLYSSAPLVTTDGSSPGGHGRRSNRSSSSGLASRTNVGPLNACSTTGFSTSPRCVLCDQQPKTKNHLLVGYQFSRQVWHDMLAWCRSTTRPPDANDMFTHWWATTVDTSPTGQRRASLLS